MIKQDEEIPVDLKKKLFEYSNCSIHFIVQTATEMYSFGA